MLRTTFAPRRAGLARSGAVVAVAAVAVVASACSGSSKASDSSTGASKAPSARDTTFIVGTPMQSEGPWDPAAGLIDMYRMVFKATYDTLVTYQGDDTSKVVGDLATSWQVSSDAKTYTFHLTDKAKFNSGNPVTSADVAFSYLRVKNLAGAAAGYATNIDSIDSSDPHTAVIHLKDPDVSFLSTLTRENFGVLDSTVAKQHGATDATDAKTADTAGPYLNTHSIGSGPYQIASYTTGQNLKMELNPKSWRPKPYFTQIILQNYTSSDAQVAALKRGDIDLTRPLSPNQLTAVKGDPNIQLGGSPGTTFYLLGMTDKCGVDPAVCKPQVQQAIRYALDYSGFDSIAQGLTQFYGMVPSYLPGGVAQSDRVATNVAKAKELLAAAGYPDGFKTTICTSTSTSYQPSMSDWAQKVANDLKAVGITAAIDAQENSAFLTKFRAGANGPNDGCKMVQTIVGPFALDPSFLATFTPGSLYGNRVGWTKANPSTTGTQVLAQQAKANATTDDTARNAIWHDVAVSMNQDSPWIPESTVPFQEASNAKIQGIQHGANQTFIYDPYTLKRG